jgi:hypothetical protein
MANTDYVDACKYEYVGASGKSSRDCMALGYRTPEGVPFSPAELESWIIHFPPEKDRKGNYAVVFEFSDACWLTGLWKSLEGPVYVSNMDGTMHIRRDWKKKGKEAWEEVELDAQLSGVWGLSDECVFTWVRKGDEHRMFRYDGRQWHPMPSPGDASVLHGVAPDLVYAVGYKGLIARWDGHSWTQLQSPVRHNFTGLFVAGPDEMYATTEHGELLAGTSHGWEKRAKAPGSLLDVAKYKGEVWVAAGEAGLLKLKGTTQELEPIKPNIKATAFDVRGNLLITAGHIVAQSEDGVKFLGAGDQVFERECSSEPPMWLEND